MEHLCMYGGGEYGPITQDAMVVEVNTDICPDFGYVHIIWKLHVMLPC
jgi:hypothetical protein